MSSEIEASEQVGKRVRLRYKWAWQDGTIVDYRNPIYLSGAVLVSAKFKVKWDDGDESGWLSVGELVFK